MHLRARGDVNFSRHFHWLRAPLSTQVADNSSEKRKKMKEEESSGVGAGFHAAYLRCTRPSVALEACSKSASGAKENLK